MPHYDFETYIMIIIHIGDTYNMHASMCMCVCVCVCMCMVYARAGRYTNFEDGMVYHGINNYYGILINTFMNPVKYSNNFSQVTSV